jgi:hypothetical protein
MESFHQVYGLVFAVLLGTSWLGGVVILLAWMLASRLSLVFGSMVVLTGVIVAILRS